MQLDPLCRNPALVLEYAHLGVGAVKMDKAHEEQRQCSAPTRVIRLRDCAFECRLIREHERLAHFPQRLPDAFGELGRGFSVLDVLLDQLPPIAAEGGIDEFDGSDSVQVDIALRIAHRVEHANDVLLPADDVERRQLPQPRRRGLGDFAAGRSTPCPVVSEIRTSLSWLTSVDGGPAPEPVSVGLLIAGSSSTSMQSS